MLPGLESSSMWDAPSSDADGTEAQRAVEEDPENEQFSSGSDSTLPSFLGEEEKRLFYQCPSSDIPSSDIKDKEAVTMAGSGLDDGAVASDSDDGFQQDQSVGDQCRLLDLPAELRNKIYRYAFIEDSPRVSLGYGEDHGHYGKAYAEPEWLRVCKQIRSEGCDVYYAYKKWKVYEAGYKWEHSDPHFLIAVRQLRKNHQQAKLPVVQIKWKYFYSQNFRAIAALAKFASDIQKDELKTMVVIKVGSKVTHEQNSIPEFCDRIVALGREWAAANPDLLDAEIEKKFFDWMMESLGETAKVQQIRWIMREQWHLVVGESTFERFIEEQNDQSVDDDDWL